MQIAELGAENEHLHRRLESSATQLEAAEQKAAALQQKSTQASISADTKSHHDKAQSLQQQAELQSLTSQNRQLQERLRLAEPKLAEANMLQQQQEQQTHAEHAEHVTAQHEWETSCSQLQQALTEVNERNQTLAAHQGKLEVQLRAAKESAFKAQHAQQAAQETHTRTAAAAAKDSRLQEQVTSLKKENALQSQHSRKLEGEVRALQQQLHDQMSQQQQSMHSISGGSQIGSPSGAKLAMVQHQAELVAAENANLQMQCKQQAADFAQSQQDVQVIRL